MTLAWQCRKYKVRKFKEELDKEDMDLWESWLAFSPQGQSAVLEQQAHIASVRFSTVDNHVDPEMFLPWKRRQTAPEVSIDDQWDAVKSLIPKAPTTTQEKSDGSSKQSDPEQQPIHGGSSDGNRVEPSTTRLD